MAGQRWTEAHFEHLLWYLTEEPRPVGQLEADFGEGFAPSQQLNTLGWKLDTGGVGLGQSAQWSKREREKEWEKQNPEGQTDVEVPTEVHLSSMIDYLEAEVADKELRDRARAYREIMRSAYDLAEGEEACSEAAAELQRGHGLVGQEALDSYVAELVARLRDFPYERLPGGREAGVWIRDSVVAPTFKGGWHFYSNRKHGNGFDLPGLENLLCGEGMLLERLHYARKAAGL